jgi:hypothetical protein
MSKRDWLERTVEALGGWHAAADAEAFLRGVRDATITEHPAIGRGTDLRITGDGLVGAALEVDGAIVHLAMFRTEGRGQWRVPQPPFATMAERRMRFRRADDRSSESGEPMNLEMIWGSSCSLPCPYLSRG